MDKSSPERDLESIRQLMERSSKFMSLSGISGVLSGIYALAGAAAGYYLIYYPHPPYGNLGLSYRDIPGLAAELVVVAILVLVFSLVTGFWLSSRKARRMDVSIWNETSKKMLGDLLIPLVTGGILILILLARGVFGVVAPVCLLFYGLALVNASQRTFHEIKFLGLCEIVLGLVGIALPGYGLLLWSLGFGVLHIVYGLIMYKRYEA